MPGFEWVCAGHGWYRRRDALVQGLCRSTLAETVSYDYFSAGLHDWASNSVPWGLGETFGL